MTQEQIDNALMVSALTIRIDELSAQIAAKPFHDQKIELAKEIDHLAQRRNAVAREVVKLVLVSLI